MRVPTMSPAIPIPKIRPAPSRADPTAEQQAQAIPLDGSDFLLISDRWAKPRSTVTPAAPPSRAAQRNQTRTNTGRIATFQRFQFRSHYILVSTESNAHDVESEDSSNRVDRFEVKNAVNRKTAARLKENLWLTNYTKPETKSTLAVNHFNGPGTDAARISETTVFRFHPLQHLVGRRVATPKTTPWGAPRSK